MKKSVIIETSAYLLFILFVYTAASKWLDMDAFIRAMHNQPFPHWLANLLVWTLPLAELVTAAMLIFKPAQRIGFALSTIMMVLFTAYIAAILLHFFPRVPCSCGGVIKQLGWKAHLFFNLFFLGLSITGWLLTRNAEQSNESNYSTANYAG